MTRRSWPRDFLRHSPRVRWGMGIAACLLLAAVLEPWLVLSPPSAQDLSVRLMGPNGEHLLGTDELGRDELARTLYGARVSLEVAFSVVFAGSLFGLAVGSTAGYFGGWFDRIVNVFVINVFLSFPGILLAIAITAFWGPGLGKVILALVITGWAGYARLARAQALKVKELEFVAAARSLGASHPRILWHHLLPSTLPPVLVQATAGLATAILAESTLSFLGLGVQGPLPSWGAMLNDARNHLFDAPHLVVFPALGIMLCVLSFNLLGDALRDWSDPRTRTVLLTQDLQR